MTASTETKIWQALKARIDSLSLSYPVIRARGEPTDVPTSGGQPVPYIEAYNLVNDPVPISGGDGGYNRHFGILQLTICWPLSNVGVGAGKTHPDVLTQRSGEIAAHFKHGTDMSFSGTIVRVERPPRAVTDGTVDGPYLRLPVSIRWFADADRTPPPAPEPDPEP